jgi:ATP phosphoribosyltransferase
MYNGVVQLLADAGITLSTTARGYRPTISLARVETKVLKPQNIVEMLHTGSRDAGFAGADWVAELSAEVELVLDLGLDPVRIVAAAPRALVDDGWPPDRPVRVASEMENLSRRWISARGLRAEFVRSFGATEVLPPEDADCIIDVTASGATLEANSLVIIDEVMRSSTRLYASRAAMADPQKRRTIENLAMLLQSVLEARKRVMMEVNVTAESLAAVIAVLPCMRQPTISTLHDGAGFAVKAAVPRELLPTIIPEIKSRGGSDLVITPLAQVVP